MSLASLTCLTRSVVKGHPCARARSKRFGRAERWVAAPVGNVVARRRRKAARFDSCRRKSKARRTLSPIQLISLPAIIAVPLGAVKLGKSRRQRGLIVLSLTAATG